MCRSVTPRAKKCKATGIFREYMTHAIGAAAVGDILGTLAVQKLISYFANKRRKSQEELDAVKRELIDGIRQYDADYSGSDSAEEITQTEKTD